MGCASSSQKQEPDNAGSGGADNLGMEDEHYNPLTEDEVNARIVCCTKAERFSLGDSGITLRYAYLSQRGYYPEDLYKANQDAFKVVPKFNNDQEQILFGVFDGHGVDGDSCSYFVRDNIEQELKRQMHKYPEDFEKAYKESFIQVNARMHDQVLTSNQAGGVTCALLWNLRMPLCMRGAGLRRLDERDGARRAADRHQFAHRTVAVSRCSHGEGAVACPWKPEF